MNERPLLRHTRSKADWRQSAHLGRSGGGEEGPLWVESAGLQTRPGIAGVRLRDEQADFVLRHAIKQTTRETTVQTAVTKRIGWAAIAASVGETYLSGVVVASVNSGAAAVLLLNSCKAIAPVRRGNLGHCFNLAFVRQKNE